MNKESEKDCFKGFNKIFVLLLIPIFVGYIDISTKLYKNPINYTTNITLYYIEE